LMSPGNKPWVALHDPGHAGRVSDGSPLVPVGEGVAALASAIGPTPTMAHATPAMAVRRLSEDNI
jgi:hypothetical protein